ncbi:anosmin-1a isoform X2 [Denticeps clupeoides]|uniref:Uncharacterized protein n=1 Tax=Denticeps clupeoides TaxID=299321 RepID=A0AAY4BTV4_9TELE|nr:anosmin-1-like isoform X2 [Denticeps clupeoides]
MRARLLWISPALLTLLLLTLLLLACGSVGAARRREKTSPSPSSSPSSLGTLFRTRCAARCLSLHSARISTSSSSRLQINGSLGWCQSHKQCAKCLEPCKDSWELEDRSCRDLCEVSFPRKHGECVTSCDFLRSVMVTKQGDCPSPEKASGFAAACVESCEEDGDCSGQKKCCPNGCGHTCQPPKNLYRGAPLKPRKEVIFEEFLAGVLEVRWSSRFNVSAEPVVYLLQRRWNYGIHPNEDDATEWEVVAQTTEEHARLTDIRSGRWYQFRMAAVNVHGTRGYSTPTKHYRTTKDPSPPPRPTNLRVTNLTFGADSAVTAQLNWTLPADPDLLVHHYKVSWSWSVTSGSVVRPKVKRRKNANGDSSSVDLDGLRANRSYTVELQAVSYWGDMPLKGQKASLHFTTTRKDPQKEDSALSSGAGKRISDIMDVGTPFYQDGQLQVRVYWKRKDISVSYYRVQWAPEICTHNGTRSTEKMVTQENYASLPNLQFSCKYKVMIQPMGTRGHTLSESTSFFTPSCATIRSKSSKHIPCPGDTVVTQSKTSARAENLTASFSVHQGNITALFTWNVAKAPALPQVTGFQVTWTEVTTESRTNSLPNSLVSQSQILPPDHNLLLVSGLQPSTQYRLEVQVITGAGEGPATFRTFQTPAFLNTAPSYRPRLKKHHAKAVVQRH